ncbi:methionine ABC transporter ATP-binding protein [Bifidobacterium simiarum]|uniref:ABC transporter ATP-binding protein n=1 Tax=Bifidobacterium simiarum TaxID=2045441 RepID=A0A2M9HEA2_9BIFI|nr:methionine ABC transporter ATP-binding protein [Bifidobacterium simiarum]PJM75107.1 ABC transporter ATP-binding protein [Bifidobacterium simiarum]
MIEIRDLRKSYGGTPVLKGVDLTIHDGEIHGIIGLSGAGKSTLLKCLNGMEPYDSGSVKVEGTEVSERGTGRQARAFKRDIGLIFQGFSLMQRKTVYDNIALPMRLWHYSKDEIDGKVRRYAKIVGLDDKLDSRPRELSGGQQQRVAIARALTLDPKTILCDEATSALDPKTTASILTLLREINEQSGIAVILVTHQMEVVKRICQNVSVLEDGRITASGSVQDVFVHHASRLGALLENREQLETLPHTGANIRISYGPDHVYDTFLSTMTRQTGVPFSLIWATTDKYRDDVLGSVIINIADSDTESIRNYLNEHHVIWEEL